MDFVIILEHECGEAIDRKKSYLEKILCTFEQWKMVHIQFNLDDQIRMVYEYMLFTGRSDKYDWFGIQKKITV